MCARTGYHGNAAGRRRDRRGGRHQRRDLRSSAIPVRPSLRYGTRVPNWNARR